MAARTDYFFSHRGQDFFPSIVRRGGKRFLILEGYGRKLCKDLPIRNTPYGVELLKTVAKHLTTKGKGYNGLRLGAQTRYSTRSIRF